MAIWCKLKRSPLSVCDFTIGKIWKVEKTILITILIDLMMQTQSVTRQKRLKSRLNRWAEIFEQDGFGACGVNLPFLFNFVSYKRNKCVIISYKLNNDIAYIKPLRLQLRIAIKDCKLPSSHDEYLRKWLLGWSIFILKYFTPLLNNFFSFSNDNKTVNGFDVARAEKMLRQVKLLLSVDIKQHH